MKKIFLILLISTIGISLNAQTVIEENRNLNSLQNEFLSWKFGMFIHYNMATYTNVGWSDGKEDPMLFNPKKLNCEQWADAAVAAKMKYGLLTVKHTGGWCLWDSEYTDHDISKFKNYKDGKGDIVKEFADAFRSRDLKVGLYYCFPLGVDKWKNFSTLPIKGYENSPADALGFIKNQFKELLTNYGKIDLIWIDQSRTSNGGMKSGDWLAFKAYVHSIQPNCVVVANNQLDFKDTDIHSYEYSWGLKLPSYTNTAAAEVCDKLQQGWFSNTEIGVDAPPVRSVDYIVNKMLLPLNYSRSNYLLNCAPNSDGLMPESVVSFLSEVGKSWNPDMNKRTDIFPKEIANNENSIALVFDIDNDSNSDYLNEALKILNKWKTNASFYVDESSFPLNEDFIKKLHNSGHEIGSKVQSDFDIKDFSARKFVNELKATNKKLKKLTKQEVASIIMLQNTYHKEIWDVLNYIEKPCVGYSKSIATKQELKHISPKIKSGDIIHIELNNNTSSFLDLLLTELNTRKFNTATVVELGKKSSDTEISLLFNKKKANIVTGAQ